MPVNVHGMTPLIQVFNMPLSLVFYRDILGFQIVADSGGGDKSSWVWLRLSSIDLMLNDQYEPGHEPSAPPTERTRWHKDTCLYFDCPDPDAEGRAIRNEATLLQRS
jgi:glyoxylase I family protein